MERLERKTRGRWRSSCWLVRQEERKNFSMMKQSVLLSDWPIPPPMGGPDPWQQALSPREKQPYPILHPHIFSSPFLSYDPSFTQLQGHVHLSLGSHNTINKTTNRHTKNNVASGIESYQHSSIELAQTVFVFYTSAANMGLLK